MAGARETAGRLWRSYSVAVVVLALGVILSLLTPSFLMAGNLMNVLTNAAVIAIVGLGMTLAIASGNFDLSVGKAFGLGGSTKLDFRVEAFNLFNHTQFGPPNQQVGSKAFGTVTSQQNKQRLIQLGLRLTF